MRLTTPLNKEKLGTSSSHRVKIQLCFADAIFLARIDFSKSCSNSKVGTLGVGTLGLVPWGWYLGVGNMGLVPWGWYLGVGTLGMVPRGWYLGVGAMGLVPWGWYHGVGTMGLVPERNGLGKPNFWH